MNNKTQRSLLGLLDSEFNKYVVAGLAAFAVDYAVLVTATELLGVYYLVSNVLGYSCGLVVSYTLNTRWVFSYRKFARRTTTEFSIFVLIVLLGLLVSGLVLYLSVEVVGVGYQLAKVISVGAVFVFNYIAKKQFLFSRGNVSSD